MTSRLASLLACSYGPGFGTADTISAASLIESGSGGGGEDSASEGGISGGALGEPGAGKAGGGGGGAAEQPARVGRNKAPHSRSDRMVYGSSRLNACPLSDDGTVSFGGMDGSDVGWFCSMLVRNDQFSVCNSGSYLRNIPFLGAVCSLSSVLKAEGPARDFARSTLDCDVPIVVNGSTPEMYQDGRKGGRKRHWCCSRPGCRLGLPCCSNAHSCSVALSASLSCRVSLPLPRSSVVRLPCCPGLLVLA